MKAPPPLTTGFAGWAKKNLFSTWYNSVLTIVGFFIILWMASGMWQWGVSNAVFDSTPESCQFEEDVEVGACWSVVPAMWHVFILGSFPEEEAWRGLLALGLFFGLVFAALHPTIRSHKGYLISWAVFPVIGFMLIRGFEPLGLVEVDTMRWGGLLLTLVLTFVGVLVSFPISVMLALGRRSKMPIVRSVSVAYIELIRGVPLITILFMASVMLPLFFPSGFTMDQVLRAQIGIIMFAAAYLAEVIRGGLQAIPKGQVEAAEALGLSYFQTTVFIVLPQALKIVIPPLVSTFIALLKDTSLVAIVGLFDLLGAAQITLANNDWLGKVAESYLFAGFLYWALCFAMSRYSRYLEQRFNTNR